MNEKALSEAAMQMIRRLFLSLDAEAIGCVLAGFVVGVVFAVLIML